MDITQWHYEVWPDHGVPTDAKCFLNFHAKVRRQMSPDSDTLVHCRQGYSTVKFSTFSRCIGLMCDNGKDVGKCGFARLSCVQVLICS